MKILYKFPCRSRPMKFFKALDNIIEMSMYDDYHIMCTLDADDDTMNNVEVRDRIWSYGSRVSAFWGFSGSKVIAINRDLQFAPNFDILCLHSDDMSFIKKGFDLDIIEAFENHHGVVHFPDQHNPGTMTYSMMSKSYFLIDKHIYDERFLSVFCDNWQLELAKKRGMYKFVRKYIFCHEHWRHGLAVKDALQEITESKEMYAHDWNVIFQLRNEFNKV